MNILVILSVFFCAIFTVNYAANILVTLPYAAKSHHQVFVPLIEELAARNHQITFLTMMEPSAQIPNVQHVVLPSGANFSKTWSNLMSSVLENSFSLKTLHDYTDVMNMACENFYQDPIFQNFVGEMQKKGRKYDVVLAMTLISECYLSWVGTLETPVVLINPSVLMANTAWLLDVPYPLSYVAMPVTPFNSTMTFKQRLINVMTSYFYYLFYLQQVINNLDVISHNNLPSSVPSLQVISNASLVLVNTHFSLDESKPTVPYIIDVGGMHCRAGKQLPKVFEEFVNSSGDDGFIVMSMGSVVQGSKLPSEFTQLFKNIFARVKQKVIWKYEDTIEGLSPNVMLSKWIPQQDLMAHPKCRLAITHGGLLSLQEVVYHGVPLLGVPLGADRDFNINQAINKGFALLLNWKEATVDEAFSKVDALINDNKYKAMAKKISQLTRDRPQTPVETAAFWVEYVIRHKGAAHLKNDGIRQLNFLQYLGLDVIAFLLSIVVVAIAILVFFIRFIFKILTGCLTKRPKLKIN